MNLIPDVETRGWKFFFAVASVVIAVAGLVIAALSALGVDVFGLKDARLVAVPPAQPAGPGVQIEPDEVFMPWGQEDFTRITYHNNGERKALIQAVSFQIESVKPTPPRPTIAGAGDVVIIPVDFKARHYDEKSRRFFMRLARPVQLDGDEYAEFRTAIQIRNWSDKTMIGILTIHFNGNKPAEVHNVEIDAH